MRVVATWFTKRFGIVRDARILANTLNAVIMF